jgi:hypothetical protein
MNVASVEAIIGALNEVGARYMVAGGLAAVAHGHVRFTADIDLIFEMSEENLIRATGALLRLGFRPRAPVPLDAFAKRENRESWRREKGMTVFSLWSDRFPMTEVDLFIEEPFEDMRGVFERSVSREIAPGIEASVIGRDDLIAMKRSAGRRRDLEDVEALEMLAREEE